MLRPSRLSSYLALLLLPLLGPPVRAALPATPAGWNCHSGGLSGRCRGGCGRRDRAATVLCAGIASTAAGRTCGAEAHTCATPDNY